jgi:hypothetical protein
MNSIKCNDLYYFQQAKLFGYPINSILKNIETVNEFKMSDYYELNHDLYAYMFMICMNENLS